MPQRKSKNTDRWADLLAKELQNSELRPKGEGWKTFEELRAHFGLGESRTYRLICQWEAEGSVERFNGNVCRNQRRVRQVWYRVK